MNIEAMKYADALLSLTEVVQDGTLLRDLRKARDEAAKNTQDMNESNRLQRALAADRKRMEQEMDAQRTLLAADRAAVERDRFAVDRDRSGLSADQAAHKAAVAALEERERKFAAAHADLARLQRSMAAMS